MDSSSGNSTTSSRIQNSGSEGDIQQVMMDERKRKRMQSNRESARRSRMRKQKQLDDLMGQVSQLKGENHQILNTISITSQQFLHIDAENSVLRAQMVELTHRLDSLNEMLNSMNTHNNRNTLSAGFTSFQDNNNININSLGIVGNNGGIMDDFGILNDNTINIPWSLGYLPQPIMPSTDVLLC